MVVQKLEITEEGMLFLLAQGLITMSWAELSEFHAEAKAVEAEWEETFARYTAAFGYNNDAKRMSSRSDEDSIIGPFRRYTPNRRGHASGFPMTKWRSILQTFKNDIHWMNSKLRDHQPQRARK